MVFGLSSQPFSGIPGPLAVLSDGAFSRGTMGLGIERLGLSLEELLGRVCVGQAVLGSPSISASHASSCQGSSGFPTLPAAGGTS